MILYHFCCAHSAADIERDGLLRPTWVTWATLDAELAKYGLPATGLAGAPTVLWLTDLAEPDDPDVLGLHPRPGICDRTEVRFTVNADATPWSTFASLHLANGAWRRVLERYGEPDRWWVATTPLRPVARLDRT